MLATPENTQRAFACIDTYSVVGSTYPLPGVKMALEMKPDLLYLLVDPSDSPVLQATRPLGD